MIYMLLFLFLCIILGLWSPVKARLGYLVAILAVLLVAFFLLAPTRM